MVSTPIRADPSRRATELGIDPIDVREGLDRNMTFPARWYWDRHIFDFELASVFPRSWVFAVSAQRVSEPGDVALAHAAHVPVVITRGLDGELRGFVNVCRHRAYPVASTDGNRKLLQCDYHAWTYELDGRLRKAPGCELETTFPMEEFSLVPVSVETWNGFVFVNPDPAARSFRETFPNLDYLEDRGFDFAERYRYVENSTFEVAANWKVGVENTTECYHCPTIHSGTFGNAFEVSVEEYEHVIEGNMLCQFTDYNVASKRWRRRVREGDRGFRFTYLFPLTFITQDDAVAFTHVIVPTAPDRFTNIYEMFVAPDLERHEIDEWLRMYAETLAEDAEAMQAQQPGLRSDLVPRGRLMPSRESSITAFHRLVWRAYGEALGVAP
jgi:phenylpropionate dioxygenase-like ring-hydroxylating dioxygenase large terminal subunit